MAQFTVLIVDDATLIRDLVKKSVRAKFPSWTVTEANDGRKAQTLLKNQRIDLVMCDWEMPEMNGAELLAWLREQERFKDLPFIMVTSRGDREHVLEAVQAGVSEYLIKPFNNDQLLRKVVRALNKHGITPDTAMPRGTLLSGGSHVGSVDALMGAFGRAAPVPTPAAPTSDFSRTVIPVRFAGGIHVQCAVKRLTLTEFVGIFKRDGVLPHLLEQAVVDIANNDGTDIARINGYIHTLSAGEPKFDSALIHIAIRFVDQDPVKLEQLTRFIASKASD